MGSVDSGWLPLGSAQVIDWKYLGRPASARGAAAWATRIDGEPLLLRTWTNEATTYYEFQFLAFEDLHGTIVVSTSRPETSRLRLLITVDVEGRLGYSDSSEFREHARTGLFGSTVRTVDVTQGNLDPDVIAAPTAAQAEIFEYAPESALHTACGLWFSAMFSAIRAQLLDGADSDELADIKPSSKPLPAPTPIKKEAPVKAAPPIASVEEDDEDSDDELELADDPPKPVVAPPKPSSTGQNAAVRRPRETMEGPAPSLAPVKQDVRREPIAPAEKPKKTAGVGKLKASTNAGDNWDLNDPETFIGRSKQCAVVLKSQRVSRKHASITKEDDGFYINDLGAANGIWVGTEKIDREKIEDGSEYIIGDVLVTFTYA